MSAEVKLEPEALDDLRRLAPDLVTEAFGLMFRLREHPHLGQALGDHPETGDLSDCRKLYFNQVRHRIIYQADPADARDPKRVRILAVGRRADLGVYRETARRLGRTPGVDAPER